MIEFMPSRPKRHHSRPQWGLVALYGAMGMMLLASIGTGLALAGGDQHPLMHNADLHGLEVASR